MAEEKATSNDPVIPTYKWRSKDVHKVELEQYLKKRRKANDIAEEATPENLSGLCISGGGVRSSTLGLGMLQAFIKAKKLKYFDYLSTVSGGGYIGACLTSLLSAEPERRDKKWTNQNGEPIENRNQKFDESKIGLEEHNSLFTNEPYEYPKMENGKLNTRHQLIHLRQHGEYLTPHKSIKDWDVHRLLGALFGGIVTNVSTFLLLLTVLVLLHHVLLAWMSGDRFIQTLQNPSPTVNKILIKRDSIQLEKFLADSIDAASKNRVDTTKKRPEVDYGQFYAPLEKVYNHEQWRKMSTSAQLHAWADHSFAPQLSLVWLSALEHWKIPLAFGAIGFLFAGIFIFWARRLPYPIAKQEQEERNFTGISPNNKRYDRKGEDDMLDMMEQPIIRWFYHIGLWGVPLAAYIITACLNSSSGGSFNYFVMLALPFCYALGLFVGLHSMIFFYFINHGEERVSGWIYRSFYTGLQGGALLIALITISFPIAIIMLFGGHGLAVNLSLSFIPVIVAYYFTMQSLGGRLGGGGFLSTIIKRMQTPLLNLSIFLFVGLAFAWISQGLHALEEYLVKGWIPLFEFCAHWNRTDVVVTLFLTAFIVLFILGMIVNANDVSLHYFYRDRLSEAFLRTSGRVETQKPGSTNPDDCKLLRINLRSHEDLQLRNIGEGNFRGPYHLIITAINLQGSHDLSAKTLKSEHFIFSKYFIGSRSTGYVSTAEYNYGSTKLSTAMAISGAAVSSGMGPLSFAASNFYLTLFNLRTGYWIDNPKNFIRYKQRDLQAKAAKAAKENGDTKKGETNWTFRQNLTFLWSKFTHKYPLWLLYIWRELTGNLSANTPKVNVSDGGHTGDNLGLLPLIQRKCSTIVVADFEADGNYSFDSFGQAVRLAKSIYNVDINIDLSQLMPQKSESGEIFSPSSTAEGVITYNLVEEITNASGQKENRFFKKTGQIIYMKSSVNLLKDSAETYDENAAPPPLSEPAPVMVLNYFKRNPKFPHQTTADQYFDEVQFEAYRMLGEHIGKQAAAAVKFGALKPV